jgi:hypothetical protein
MRPLAYLLLLVFFLASACSGASAGAPEEKVSPPSSKQILVFTPRSMVLEQYPCSECHAQVEEVKNPAGPVSSPHRGQLFDHMPSAKKCDQCHDLNNLDRLRLIDGTQVSFDESATLCGQCHQERFKDWQIGAHGKRVGNFLGQTHVYTCADCHQAHAPAFRHTPPKEPPPKHRLAIDKKAKHEKGAHP